jgi:Ca2+-binding RTX toxin-like protein
VFYARGANLETLTGSGNIDSMWNLLNNILTGNAGNNTLHGGAGADAMAGGAGNDLYKVDTAGETVSEHADPG